MKNKLKVVITTAILLAASSALAGIIFLPAGGQYIDPSLAPVNIQNLGEGSVRIRTTGLNGELSLKGSDFPPDYEVPATATGILPVVQQLELVINRSTGVVEGRSRGQVLVSNEIIQFRADVRGNASCLPLNGRSCGQLVVDLELRGTLSDPNNTASVGRMQMEMLGSLVWEDTDAVHWAAMSANATLGVNEVLINSLLETMEEGEVGV